MTSLEGAFVCLYRFSRTGLAAAFLTTDFKPKALPTGPNTNLSITRYTNDYQ